MGLSKFISSAATDIVDSVADLGDRWFTSDEERIKGKGKIANILSSLAATIEQETTKRWQSDNNADAWLTKNVRPISFLLTLVFVMVVTIVSCFFVTDLGTEQLINSWMEVWKAVLITMVMGFFGSRGIEKAVDIWKNRGRK